MSDSPNCVESSQQVGDDDISSSPITLPPSPEKPYLAAAKSASSSVVPPNVQLSLPTTLATSGGNSLPPWKSGFGSFSAMERGDTLSSAGSHDRMETLSNLTSHMELESVVSCSWVDDDDYFLQSAMHDIQVTSGQQQGTASGKGWKVATTSGGGRQQRGGGSGAPRKQQPQRQRNGSHFQGAVSTAAVSGTSSNAPSQSSVSGGRFDALSSEPKRRR
ncbi:Hypothetical protein, putative [Bodo saltans]|uniref:Uncharacterized protein n=1 Tax=Bodo saltans TaxID=75058 RepID=A0A0S4J4Q4_BODSA|nr:Hypothetical protein, putative [Bodo saltans]|eukprot:CUG86395.1 Hypothetical protein, putative [Bodo saltans]